MIFKAILWIILLNELCAEFCSGSHCVMTGMNKRNHSDHLCKVSLALKEKFCEGKQVSPLNTKFRQENCYPWMFYNETSRTCNCSDIPNRAIHCDPTYPWTSIMNCYCMTYNHEQNETELGECLFGCRSEDYYLYYKLPHNIMHHNTHTCAKANRDSTLCGKCKAGYSPLVYSYDMSCMNCTGMTYNWIKYIAIAYIPLTFFFVFVVLVRFDGTSPLVRGCISICQGIVSPSVIRRNLIISREKRYIKVLGTLYGIWNLDFFRTIIPPLCLNISPLGAIAIDYAIAFYPLLLVLVTYVIISLHSHDVGIVVWLWKPFRKSFSAIRRNWDLEESVVNAFATFFMLSFLKILNVTIDLLVSTNKYTLPLGEQSYRTKLVLYYDASVEYFRGQHLYYGISAIVVGFFFVILPLVFLVVYPMHSCQKCLNYLGIQRHSLDMFVNCYQGYYKDGTNGTRDCRCFSVALFFIQTVLLSLFAVTKSVYCFSLGVMFLTALLFLTLAVQPYKEQFKVYSIIDAFMYILLVFGFSTAIAIDEVDARIPSFATPSYIFLGFLEIVPAIYFSCLFFWWVFVKKKFHYKLPCFGTHHFQEPCDSDYLPHRIENPRIYEDQEAPLLTMSRESLHSDVSYGTAVLT